MARDRIQGTACKTIFNVYNGACITSSDATLPHGVVECKVRASRQ